MDTLEGIVREIATLPVAEGERRLASAVWPDRLYLALGPTGQPELFFRGSRESFEGVAFGRALAWGDYEMAESEAPLPALVVRTAATRNGRRLMAHIAYEARRCLEEDPVIDNVELIHRLRSFLLLALQDQVLSAEEQVGLMGELQLLHEILEEGTTTTAERAEGLSSWCGPEATRRDYYKRAIAVEVKASRSGERHRVGLEQLLRRSGDERLFLCSVRIRRDGSAPLRLARKIEAIEQALGDGELVEILREKLGVYGSCGYRVDDRPLYELEAGFFVERTVMREIGDSTPILRPESFRPGQPPATVGEISYLLDVRGVPAVTRDVRAWVFARLVGRDR